MGKETSERYFITSGEVKKRLSMSQKPQSHGFKPRQFRKVPELPCCQKKSKVNPKTPVRYRGASRSPKVYRAGVKNRRRKAAGRKPEVFRCCYEIRTRRRFSRTSAKSLPIKQLYGPSVPQMIKNEKIMKAINDDANETLQKRIDAEINNLLRRGKTCRQIFFYRRHLLKLSKKN